VRLETRRGFCTNDEYRFALFFALITSSLSGRAQPKIWIFLYCTELFFTKPSRPRPDIFYQ
jgi:hypothetical protein